MKLEAEDKKSCRLIITEVTDFERRAVGDFLEIYALRRPLTAHDTFFIPETISKAHKKLVKILKSGNPVLNAVKLHDGKMEIVQSFGDKDFDSGVTTEKPKRGCPMPIWERGELRAQRVLQEFLSTIQWDDFERHKAFISKGNYSGMPYLLTSRWSPECAELGTLYSLSKHQRICASLDTLPPAEELLALKIAVECDERNFVGIS